METNLASKGSIFKLHYVTAPEHVRIDPTFFPIRRRRDWETFERLKHGERQTWLNYPLLPEPAPDRKPTKKYVVDTLNNYIHRLKGIPDLSCVMLSKIARMIVTIITSFNDMSQARAHWTTYFEGPSGLAWDQQVAPRKEILMGLYARYIFLPAHWDGDL